MNTTPSELRPRASIRDISPLAWIVGGILTALLAYVFRAPIDWMVDRWNAPESYYSHGILVPPVALFIIWTDRHRLLASPPERSTAGLVLFIAGLIIYLASGFIVVYFTAMFSMILMVWGLCGFLFGWPAMKRLAFPMFILTFMVPLPLETIASISFKMKMLATKIALVTLNGIGIVSDNDGASIFLGNEVVTVGNACSGLRSLISLIFLGVLFAYLTPLTFPRKLLLVALSIPIAILANVIRVLGLCLYVYHFGSANQTAFTRIHDISGYMIFVVAFILLYLASRLIGLGLTKEDKTTAPPEGTAAHA